MPALGSSVPSFKEDAKRLSRHALSRHVEINRRSECRVGDCLRAFLWILFCNGYWKRAFVSAIHPPSIESGGEASFY